MTAAPPLVAAGPAVLAEEVQPQPLGQWRRLPVKAKAGAILLGIFVLAAVIGPFVAPYDPAFQSPDPSLALHAPSAAHLRRSDRGFPRWPVG